MSVFDSETTIGDFNEVVRPGAFRDCLATKPDVRALINHNPDLVLGRTNSGTLRLNEDSTGLHFDCTQAARDLLASIKRGDVDGCSFGFSVRKQRWTEKKDAGGLLRELLTVDIFDVSIATFPAYVATSVSARALWPQGIPVEVSLRCRIGKRVSASAGRYVLCPNRGGHVYAATPDGESLEVERAWDRVRLSMRD